MVEAQVSDAVALVQALDAAGESPTFAAWYYYDDADEWRFLLAGPTFDALLPKQEPVAYRKVVDAISSLSLGALAVSDVKLLESHAALPRTIAFLLATPADGVTRAHFTDTTVNGIFIKEMIILRSAVGRG